MREHLDARARIADRERVRAQEDRLGRLLFARHILARTENTDHVAGFIGQRSPPPQYLADLAAAGDDSPVHFALLLLG